MEVEAPQEAPAHALGNGAAHMAMQDNGGNAEQVLLVPLGTHGEDGPGGAVELPMESLPEDPEEVVNLLCHEAAQIQAWLDTAKGYLSRGLVKPFLDILQEAVSDDVLSGIRHFYSREPVFERAALLCALGGYYLEAARVEVDPANKASKMTQAEEHIREAAVAAPGEMLPALAKGMLAQAKNDNTAAMVEFRRAATLLHNGAKNHAPLLAQAALLFGQGNMAGALHLYARVLRENPDCPAEVRMGIGAAYYRAGKVEAAAAAYNRVLQLHPGCADALLGLAMIKFGSRDVQEGLHGGLQLLMRAFEADPSHPGVLVALGHFSLIKGDVDQAQELARMALESADTTRLRVACQTLLGRCAHARGHFAEAAQHYQSSIRADPNQPLAHIGHAQAHLACGGDAINVVTELDNVLKQLQGNPDALTLLGGLMPIMRDRVVGVLMEHKEAAARQVHDPALQEILGELLATTEPAAALAAFERAVALRRDAQQAVITRNTARAAKRAAIQQQQQQQQQQGGGDGGECGALGPEEAAALLAEVGEDEAVPPLPAKLLNNTAVLKYRSGDVSGGLALMQEATSSMQVDGTPAMHMVTLGYNIARLQEAAGDLKAAAQGYTSLVGQFPGYIDCYLRLAALARTAGEADKAREWADKATQQAGGDVDAQATLATLHLHRGSLQEARNCITAAQQAAPEASSDPYLLLTHANVVMASLRADPPSRLAAQPEDARRQRDYVRKALENYKAVLKAQPDNIYAVNGIGACMAELGHLGAAKAAFDEVVRGTSKTKGFVVLPETYTNLGHIWLARKAFPDAIKMYSHAAKLQGGRDGRLLMLQARTHHDAGDEGAARRCLVRAMHMHPWDTKLRFNLAYILQEEAGEKLKSKHKDGDPRQLADYERSMQSSGQASRMFQHMLSQGKDCWALLGMKQDQLEAHMKYCDKAFAKGQEVLAQAQRKAAEAEAKKRLRQAEFAQAEADRLHREELANAAERAQQEFKQAEARRALAESRQKVEALRQQRPLIDADDAAAAAAAGGGGGEGRRSGKKRRKGGAGGGGGEEEFYVDDAAPIERLPKKKDAKAELKRGGLASSDEDEDVDVDEQQLFGSDAGSDDDDKQEQQQQQDGGDGDGGEQQRQRPRGGGRLRRQAAAAAAGDEADGGDGGAEQGMDGDWQEEEEEGGGGGGGGGAPADEGLGENDAGTFQVDALFADELPGDDEAGEGGGQQPRKRQRQTLESDDEEMGEDGDAQAGGGGADAADAAAAGNGAASEDIDDLF